MPLRYARQMDNSRPRTLARTLIPAKSQATVAYGTNGKMATVAIGRNLPVTPGSVNSESSNPLAIVSFDLNSSDAISISADREMVDIDTFVLGSRSPSVFRDAKAVTFTASANTSMDFFTALDWEGKDGVNPTKQAFSTSSTDERFLATIKIGADDTLFSFQSSYLILLEYLP